MEDSNMILTVDSDFSSLLESLQLIGLYLKDIETKADKSGVTLDKSFATTTREIQDTLNTLQQLKARLEGLEQNDRVSALADSLKTKLPSLSTELNNTTSNIDALGKAVENFNTNDSWSKTWVSIFNSSTNDDLAKSRDELVQYTETLKTQVEEEEKLAKLRESIGQYSIKFDPELVKQETEAINEQNKSLKEQTDLKSLLNNKNQTYIEETEEIKQQTEATKEQTEAIKEQTKAINEQTNAKSKGAGGGSKSNGSSGSNQNAGANQGTNTVSKSAKTLGNVFKSIAKGAKALASVFSLVVTATKAVVAQFGALIKVWSENTIEGEVLKKYWQGFRETLKIMTVGFFNDTFGKLAKIPLKNLVDQGLLSEEDSTYKQLIERKDFDWYTYGEDGKAVMHDISELNNRMARTIITNHELVMSNIQMLMKKTAIAAAKTESDISESLFIARDSQTMTIAQRKAAMDDYMEQLEVLRRQKLEPLEAAERAWQNKITAKKRLGVQTSEDEFELMQVQEQIKSTNAQIRRRASQGNRLKNSLYNEHIKQMKDLEKNIKQQTEKLQQEILEAQVSIQRVALEGAKAHPFSLVTSDIYDVDTFKKKLARAKLDYQDAINEVNKYITEKIQEQANIAYLGWQLTVGRDWQPFSHMKSTIEGKFTYHKKAIRDAAGNYTQEFLKEWREGVERTWAGGSLNDQNLAWLKHYMEIDGELIFDELTGKIGDDTAVEKLHKVYDNWEDLYADILKSLQLNDIPSRFKEIITNPELVDFDFNKYSEKDVNPTIMAWAEAQKKQAKIALDDAEKNLIAETIASLKEYSTRFAAELISWSDKENSVLDAMFKERGGVIDLETLLGIGNFRENFTADEVREVMRKFYEERRKALDEFAQDNIADIIENLNAIKGVFSGNISVTGLDMYIERLRELVGVLNEANGNTEYKNPLSWLSDVEFKNLVSNNAAISELIGRIADLKNAQLELYETRNEGDEFLKTINKLNIEREREISLIEDDIRLKENDIKAAVNAEDRRNLEVQLAQLRVLRQQTAEYYDGEEAAIKRNLQLKFSSYKDEIDNVIASYDTLSKYTENWTESQLAVFNNAWDDALQELQDKWAETFVNMNKDVKLFDVNAWKMSGTDKAKLAKAFGQLAQQLANGGLKTVLEDGTVVYDAFMNEDGIVMFSPEQIEAMDNAKDFVQWLLDRMGEINDSAYGESVFGKLKSGFEGLITAIKTGKAGTKAISDNINKITSASQALQSVLRDIVDAYSNIAELTNNDALKSTMETMSHMLDVWSESEQGAVAGFQLSNHWIGAIVGGVAGLIRGGLTWHAENVAEELEKENKLAELKLEYQLAYNKLLREQNELLMNADTIFGTDRFGQLKGYYDNMMDAQAWLNDFYRKRMLLGDTNRDSFIQSFANIDKWSYYFSQASDEQIAKFMDRYAAKLSGTQKQIYDDLMRAFDENGMVDLSKLHAFYDTYADELDDDFRRMLDEYLDYADAVEEATENIKQYYSKLFGSIGGSFTDAFTDAINNGAIPAINNLKAVFSDALTDMGKELLYNAFFARYFTALSDQIQKLDPTSAGYEGAIMGYLDSFFADISSSAEGAAAFWNYYKDLMATYGYSAEEAVASMHGIESITRAQAGELMGRTTAIQANSFIASERLQHIAVSIDNFSLNMDVLTRNSTSILGAVLEIRDTEADIYNRISTQTSQINRIYNIMNDINSRGVKIYN